MPAHLQRFVAQESDEGRTWACWADPFNTWLLSCEMSLASSRERGIPVLQVNLYDEAGKLKESGSWMAEPGGTWHRCFA